MPGLSVTDSDRQERAARHARRLRVRRAILAAMAVGLSIWLAASALASTGPARVILILVAIMIPLHVLFWQLGSKLIESVQKLPRPIALPIVLIALATSPMALYPLGGIAIFFSLFAGSGAATPALAVAGLVLLSPLLILLLIGLAFALSGYKGG